MKEGGKKKLATEIAYDSIQMLGDFKVTIINMFTELKEIIIKALKEGIMTMPQQIENRDRHYFEKLKLCNSKSIITEVKIH